MKKLSTEPLSREQLIQTVHDFIGFVRNNKISTVKVMFGFNTETEDIYKDIEIKSDKLIKFFQENISNGVINVGYSDFFIKSDEFEFLLGNDKNLIFRSMRNDLIDQIRNMWEKRGIKIYLSIAD